MCRTFWICAIAMSALRAMAVSTQSPYPCDFSVAEEVANGDIDIAKKVESIFTINCTACHGKGQAGGAGVMTDILDRDAILRDGMIDVANPEYSKIYAAIGEGPNARKVGVMPKGNPALSADDKKVILEWIKGGAANWAAGLVNDPILSHRQERACIRWDQARQAQMHGNGILPYLRYITVGHLKGKDFVTARDGACKMLQLLSRNGQGPKDCKENRWVDSLGKILRVDTRDYEPTFDVNAWEKQIIPGYPYAYEATYDRILNDYTNDINRAAYSEWAFVRADFFISRATDGKVYQKILKIPDTLNEFELKQLGIDTDKELNFGYGKRGSVNKSGVTHNPRFVDWFPLDIYATGSFHRTQHWITRDFNSDKGRRNIYAFPAGPQALNKYASWTEQQLFTNKVFQNDASESITGKGDGFDVYAIWNGAGKFLTEADPKIAIDRSGLFDDDIVRNPLGCIRCHAAGANQFNDDTVIDHIKGSPAFSVAELDFFSYLFFKPAERSRAFSNHSNSFNHAMQALGLKNPAYQTPGGEPISNAFNKFNAWITCDDLAWEIGISEPRLENVLHHSPDLANRLGMGDCKTGKLSRENYVHLFPEIVRDFNIGTSVKIGHVNPYVPPPAKCRVKLTNRTNYWVSFNAGYDGANETLRWAPNATKIWDTNSAGNLSYGKNRWSLVACKNHSFQYRNGYVSLYQE